MTFEEWKKQLAIELSRVMVVDKVDGADYIRQTGDDCWREMFDDGLSPADAASEELCAAMECADRNR